MRLKFKRFYLVLFILLIGIQFVGAHDTGVHSAQLGYVLFGYQSGAEINSKTNRKTTEAYELIRRAIAVAIDETNKGGKHSSDYEYLRKELAGRMVVPKAEDFRITNKYHRQVCHQGFDYTYNNPASQTRWQTGRRFLINVVAVAFGNPRPLNPSVAEFIAMIAYYTHLIGDLEEGETHSMKGRNSTINIGTYNGLISELITKISNYGMKLPNKSMVDELVEELSDLKPSMPTVAPTSMPTLGLNRTEYSTQIFEALAEYIPDIISNNVDSGFIFNTNAIPLEQAA